MDTLKLSQLAGAQLVRGGRGTPNAKGFENFLDSMGLKGRFVVEHWRKGERIDERQFDNGITNEGKNFLLNAMFDGGTQNTTWYLGLITNASYSALAATDTYANIGTGSNGWGESTVYTGPGEFQLQFHATDLDPRFRFGSDDHQLVRCRVRHHGHGHREGRLRRGWGECPNQERPHVGSLERSLVDSTILRRG